MRQLWTGSTIVLSCLWAVALYFNTAVAGEQVDKIASATPAVNTISPFREAPGFAPLTLNENLTPIDIPGGSHLRGLSLSGNCQLTKIGEAGESDMAGMHAQWNAQYNMGIGCALLHGYSPVLIEAGCGAAYIASGASAIVHVDPDATRFVNLTDEHRKSIRVVFHKHYIDLEPGQELVLVKTSSKDAKEIAVQQGIGWKEMQFEMLDNVIAFVYRAQTEDMLEKCRIYRQLSQSTCAEDKRIRDHIVKTVAALETMYDKKKGPFHLDAPYVYGSKGAPAEQKEAAKAVDNPV